MIFVDESGDLGLARSEVIASRPYYILGFVFVRDPAQLRKRLRRYLKKIHLKGWYPPHLRELKFYLPKKWLFEQGYPFADVDARFMPHMPTVRKQALHIVADHSEGVFAAIVNKTRASPTWSSVRLGNFVFAQTLVVNILNELALPECPLVLYDKGRLSPTNTVEFQQYISRKDSYFADRKFKRYSGTIAPPIETSSLGESGIWAADLVAGAYYMKFQDRDASCANILTKRRIGLGERLYWP